MPTSGPGSRQAKQRGFTLIELMIVVAIVAVAAGALTLALRDPAASRLEEEGARLAALLEMARAESRVAGTALYWRPVPDVDSADFRFSGNAPLGTLTPLPHRWLTRGVSAEVLGSPLLVLGPEAILPPQRIVLRLNSARLELASDGLAPFAVVAPVQP